MTFRAGFMMRKKSLALTIQTFIMIFSSWILYPTNAIYFASLRDSVVPYTVPHVPTSASTWA
jgi:hypothetical protein